MEASVVLQNVWHQESLTENSDESLDPFYTFSFVTLWLYLIEAGKITIHANTLNI